MGAGAARAALMVAWVVLGARGAVAVEEHQVDEEAVEEVEALAAMVAMVEDA